MRHCLDTLPLLRRRSALMRIAAGLAAGVLAGAQAPGPLAPTVVVVFGDSQAQGLAGGLVRQLRGDHRFRVINRTKPGSAIGQPKTFDWVAAVHESVIADRPALAVMMFGGNDRVPAHLVDGRTLAFRSAEWLAFYREQLKAMLDNLSAAGARVIWCGDPIARDAGYSNDMGFLNNLYRDAVAAQPGAWFFDTWRFAADENGAFQAYGPDVTGVRARLRTDDGIHFTLAGYDKLAHELVEQLSPSNSSG